jgi:hypothetical protein
MEVLSNLFNKDLAALTDRSMERCPLGGALRRMKDEFFSFILHPSQGGVINLSEVS